MLHRAIFLVCILLCSFCSLTLTACVNGSQSGNAAGTDSTTLLASEQKALAIPLPTVPSYLTEPEERAMYMLLHYWDEFSFADTTYLQNPDKLEASFANFAGLAVSLPLGEVESSLLIPLEKSSGRMLRYFLDMYQKYFYQPASPMHNEEYFLPILSWAEQSPKLDFATQERLKSLARLVRRNKVGTKAFDFSVEMADGQRRRLYSFAGDYLLLIFYTPGCHTCQKMIEQIQTLPELAELHKARRVTSLYVYSESDHQAWLDYQSELPPYAYNGMNTDGQILSQELYDLKASPTVYLLDKQKNVLLKDVSLETVLDYLGNHLGQ